MKVIRTELDPVWLLEPRVWEDRRGFFFEAYNQRAFAEIGITATFVQDNHSKSCRHTLRGMHYQAPPRAQAKLVRVIAGEVLDVAVDLRRSSPTFGRWVGVYLSAANRQLLFIPKGFAHGFCVVSETAEVIYKCTDFYAPEAERGFAWNDPAVDIQWPTVTPTLSDRDQRHPPFASLPPDFP
jgi:dTDP-4-dehydrorhamnose 3,5-epimerase